MSIIHSIINCRRPIAQGYARNIYYSKKYDVIIKKDKEHLDQSYRQNKHEFKIAQKLTDKEREIIPIVDVIVIKGEIYILWKRVLPLDSMFDDNEKLYALERLNYWWEKNEWYHNLLILVGILKLKNNISEIISVAKKYKLDDLKTENFGILNNHLVIIDCGVTDDYFSD